MASDPQAPAKNRHRDLYGERLRKRRHRLSPRLLVVADYIDAHRHGVLGKSALEIARDTGTSDATVIRAIQSLGFDGLIDLKDQLQAYLGQTDSPVEKMSATTDVLSAGVDAAIDFVIEDQAHAMAALGSAENRRAIAATVALLAGARRIGVFGVGASGIIASYAARLFLRSGYPSYVLERTGFLLAEQLLQMEQGDVLLALLHGRAHREAQTTIAEAERLGIPIVMIVGQPDTVLIRHAAAHIVIPRAKSDLVALHAPTLTCVETIMLGLAGHDRDRTVASIDRLIEMREQIRPNRR